MAGKTRTPKSAGKENAPMVKGKAAGIKTTPPTPADRYATLDKKRSAFAELSAEAKVKAAAAPPLKENAVPVGMRRSDKKNRSRYSDGAAVEPAPMHRNAVAIKNGSQSTPGQKKEKSIKEMKAEMRQNSAKRVTIRTPEQQSKKSEKRKRAADDDGEELQQNGSSSYLLKRMQQLANEDMERQIARNKNKRARQESSDDEEIDVTELSDDDANELALVPVSAKGTPHPIKNKRSRLSSGVTVDRPVFDVEDVPYTVEEPTEDDEDWGDGVRKSKIRTNKSFKNMDFSAFEKEMAQQDPYDEEEDEDFEEESDSDEEEDEDEEESDDEELIEMEASEGEEDEDEELSDEEVSDEDLVSTDLDEEGATIRPEDILRTITFDEQEVEGSDDDDDDEDDEDYKEEPEGEKLDANMMARLMALKKQMRGGCCDEEECCDGDAASDDSMDDEDESEGDEDEDGDTSDSSHISDDSYGEAFVDDEMDQKSVVLTRTPSPKKGKGAAAAAAAIDFTAHPFKDADSAVSASRALDWLLSPCEVQSFFEDFFQSTSLVVRRNDPSYYGNLFSTSSMTTILREHCLEYGVNVNVALYENGVRTTHNGTGRAYSLAIGDAIRSGCSVQLTNPQTYSREVWYLCDTLQEIFHCFVGANTYLTPAGASGFAPHWDEIDAFLLQVEGRKYWRVWAPESPEAELPLESSGNFTEKDMEGRKPAFEGWIEAGDMLYIPRGFIHQARTDKSVHSLHVTISAGRQWTFSNLLQKLLPDAMDAFTASRAKLRRQLPPGLLDMTGVAELPGGYPSEEAADTKLNPVLDRHMSQFRAFVGGMQESAVDLMAREFIRTALPPMLTNEEKQLSAWGNDGADLFKEKGASRITPASQVRFIRRHGQRLLFSSPEEPFVVHRMANARQYEGAEERTFQLTAEEEPAFCDLLSAYPDWTTVSELSIKKKAAKIALLTKLFNHGLIMVRSA